VLVDVDYFALENMFESTTTRRGATHRLVNIGARYSSINILKAGSLTSPATVPVGAPSYSDALVRQLGSRRPDAEALKAGPARQGRRCRHGRAGPRLGDEFIVEEIQRALSFFWTAATDEPLGGIILSGARRACRVSRRS